MQLLDDKTLREQGFEPTHELAAIEKAKTEPPAATRVPSNLSEEPANVLHPPEAGEVVMKGTELLVRYSR